jgi:dolichol-phosphate mannosyltransferase
MSSIVLSEPTPVLDVTLVVPVLDEAENIAALAEEIEAALAPTAWSWECVWVDDGSTDGTALELARLHERDPRHGFVHFDRRRGQSLALAEGFAHARGRLIATMDGDGQNDPADLPRILTFATETGADVVNGVRVNRRNTWLRRISSRIANGFRNWVTRERVRDVGCSLRVMRRAALDGVLVFKGMHRFLPTLVRMNGYGRIFELPVNDRARLRGRTKYGVWNRLWVGIGDTLMVRWLSLRTAVPDRSASSASGEPGGEHRGEKTSSTRSVT